ncbi:hypothetical protein PsAD2_04009 [Pseudovibrio axinellae]|uniref:Polysaccharide pyruvyl transferase n=1 Tax=Pseudovibrio axinellae TaxID=989403 RepID=A0A165U2E8_9HYPH|nr:hypothetical protein [Pseudovibrio axinellae]KZL09808.1 hypothetical protein PsAD2_04009 [Pseudovibrio axinellae]SER94276.1 hypothetical protein SAMN05421798_1731 [Pseudovibrio axinellae]
MSDNGKNIKNAALLSYGKCSNAGDVLIYETFCKLFSKEIQPNWHHVRLDELDTKSENIIIGPGGLLSGSYKPDVAKDQLVIRHLKSNKIQSWRSVGKRLFAFGTGTNTPFDNNPKAKPFSAKSQKTIADFVASSGGMYLRGSADIRRLSAFCASEDLHKFKFQPCPSVFLDRLFSIKPTVSDQIAVNFPFRKTLTKENYKDHPINKFIEFSRANGLSVSLLDNHPQDISSSIPAVFSSPVSDPQQFDFINSLEGPLSDARYAKLFEDRWSKEDPIAKRFNGYRFSFGARLHSFLPFMAFNTPSAFLAGSEIRTPMALEYFRNPVFGAKTPLGKGSFSQVVDGMIDRLKFFMKYEDQLRNEISDERSRLWEITMNNKADMLSRMS